MKKINLFFIMMIVLSGLFITSCKNEQQINTYTMYIGLNDKDLYKQIISTEEAEKIILKVASTYTSGGSIYPIMGFWQDETGEITTENSFVCIFVDASYDSITKIADELLEKLNQNSIMITKSYENKEFYYRKQ